MILELREQLRQMTRERASLLRQLGAAHQAIARDREAFLAARPVQVVHVVRQEGPTSEAYIGFPAGSDVDSWLEQHRTERWVHTTLAPLLRPEEFV